MYIQLSAMVLFLVFILLHVSGLVSQTYSGALKPPAIDMTTKPVMCSFRSNFSDSPIPKVGIDCFPCECEVILYEDFRISNASAITVDTGVLKQVASLKPTIIVISRDNGFIDWVTILQSGGNQKDADVLCKLAQDNNLLGFELKDLTIGSSSLDETYTPTVMQNLPAYLKQLKFSNEAIIGLRILPTPPVIKSSCVTDFASLNDLVNYYEIFTYMMNQCEPQLSNGMSPIPATEHGENYQLGMEEVTGYLKKTAVDYKKIYYTVELNPYDFANDEIYFSYEEVCFGGDFSTWCIENTKDFFDKGRYVKKESCGMNVRYVQCDDVNNACGCGSFVGFYSILAGYTGSESVKACPKFDQGAFK